MQTHLEFRSTAFPAYPGEEEEINPGRHGKRLAEFLAKELPAYDFKVARLNAEDWGWRIDLLHDAFPLWIGCGNYEEYEEGFLCFIEPSRPFVRRWLTRVSTSATVERLASALEEIVLKSGHAALFRGHYYFGDTILISRLACAIKYSVPEIARVSPKSGSPESSGLPFIEA